MMKRWSIKLKLTCLYGGFMILLIVAALAILFSLSTQEVLSSVQSDLKEQVQGSVEELDLAATPSVETDYGLTLDEAFCDGDYVYLTLQLTGPEEAEQYDHYVMYLPNEEGTRLTVNGQETELFTTGGQTLPDGDYAFALVYELAAPAQDGEELSAALTVPGLYGVYSVDESKSKDWRYDQVGGEFTADFTVTADTSQNQSQELSAQDNGVKLYGIETTPGYLLVDMEIPFWGRQNELTAGSGPILGYAQLFTQDGQELNHNSLLNDYDFSNESDAESIRGTWAFDGPPEQTDTVILRITDRSPDSAYAADMDRERAVFAEFAINWKTGEAHPSHTYLDEGLDKVDTEEFKASWGPADFTGGFLVSNIGHTFDSWHGDINTTWVCTVNLTSEVEYQPIELRYYAGDRLLGTVQAAPKSEFNETAVNPMLGDENFFYRGEDGFYGSIEKDGGGYNLFFALYYPEDCIGTTQFRERDLKNGCMVDRIEVVNTETGQVLMDDLEVGQAYSPEQ